MKKIKLTQGKFALVDDEDFEWLNQWKWYAGAGGRCAVREEKERTVYMHRLIISCPDNKQTDHINGNTFDNRKINLRACTNKENCRNKGIGIMNKSGYKGVRWHKNNWYAQIKVNQKCIHLGVFSSLNEAILSYNKATIEFFGVFARPNKI